MSPPSDPNPADGVPADHELTVSRVIDAPRRLVFKAWTEPEQIARWWGPKGFTTVEYTMDVRPGGAYWLVMRSPEGTDHRKRGVYREIVVPERIVFTFAWEDAGGRLGHELLVTVTLEELGSRTRLTLHQTMFDSVEWRDSHVIGWTSCFERFAEYMTTAQESHHATPDRIA
jgi:uncharacterized protein YndB with AHSA1/START domain